MAISLYMDVHVPQAITDQLRRRGVDVLTAFEDGSSELPDDQLLQRAHEFGRLMFTQDIRFKAMAEDWQRTGRAFSGLCFGHQLAGTIGDYVNQLELIAIESEPQEWFNSVEHLPW